MLHASTLLLVLLLPIGLLGCGDAPVDPPDVDPLAWQSGPFGTLEASLLQRYVGCYRLGPHPSLPDHLQNNPLTVRLHATDATYPWTMRLTVTPYSSRYQTWWRFRDRTAHLIWAAHNGGFTVILDKRGVTPRASFLGRTINAQPQPLEVRQFPCRTTRDGAA